MNSLTGGGIVFALCKDKSFCSTISRWIFLRRNFYNLKNSLNAQSTFKTHPHLLKENEIIPGCTAGIYRNRRTKLFEKITKESTTTAFSNTCHLVVIPSNSVVYMTENIPYPFRQNSDFFYLTGYKEADSVLLLCSSADKTRNKSILFIPKQSAHSEKWEGPKLDLESVTNFLGIDEALYLDELEKFIKSFAHMNKKFTLWYDYACSHFPYLSRVMESFKKTNFEKMLVESPRYFIHDLRLLKSTEEINLMRISCEIAAESMKEVMKFSKPFILESHLHAKMDFECRLRGADHFAFPPVVAGGDRAYTIHYSANNQPVNDGDMVLIDAGCEYHGYCSDMARTWPVNGIFTDPQKELYEAVLTVQENLIKMCEQKPSLDHLFKIMCLSLGKQFQNLGMIPKTASTEEILMIAYELCPHHVSHYLGMDVHDTGFVSRGTKLQSGMVVTIEPGIYIAKDNTQIPERYRGLCIRIEDDILITDNGYDVLTAKCPKHIMEIENWMKA